MATPVVQQVSAQPLPADRSGLSSGPGSGSVEAPAFEQAADAQINAIVERLQWRYTREQISIVDLNGRVRGFYRQFDAARVRNFVAILVEGLVRRSIPSPALGPRAL